MQALHRFQGPRLANHGHAGISRNAGFALVGLLLAAAVGLAQVPPPPNSAAPAAAAAPARLVVSDVIIQGSRLVSSEAIKNQMKTRVGKEYVVEVLQDDVRALFKTGQFGNVWADHVPDGPGRVKVHVYIRDYPNVIKKITYEGNRTLSKDDLDSVTNLRVGTALNPVANKVACRRIIQRYLEEGRPLTSCDLIKGGEAGDSEVIFNITEGPLTRVKSISFVGNNFVSGAVLSNRINSSSKILGLFGGKYNQAMTDNDVNELIKYYRSFGFHDVKVNRELQYSADGREVAVTFHIVEGSRYQLAEAPQVVGVKSMPKEALEAMTVVKAGQTYTQADVDKDLARIRDYLGYQGREVRVQAVPVFSEKTGVMRVQYKVQEQKPVRVGQIFIVGNERTKQNVILRQVPLYPGQILTFPDIRQGERNLARLGIFEVSPDGSVKPTITVLENRDNPESEFRDILITVQEASTGSLMFGVGVNSDSGLTGSVVLNERNFDIMRWPTNLDDLVSGGAFRGAGQEFRLEVVPGTELQRYVATFREPFLFDSPYSLTVSGYFFQRYFNEYTEDRTGARITVGRRLDNFWSVGLTTRVENVHVRDVPFWAPPDYRDVVGDNFQAGFRGSLTFDDRDSLMRPTEGRLFDLAVEQVVGDFTYTQANVDLSQFFTTYQRADGSGKHVLALHGQVGWSSDNTPVYERFFGGGFRSIRGFEFRGVGPDVNNFKVGGNFLLLASAEYQIPVRANDQVYVVGFVDSGTVSKDIDDFDTFRVSAGFGVRFVVPMLGPVPIALDFGFPIVKASTDREQIFNFFMGFTR